MSPRRSNVWHALRPQSHVPLAITTRRQLSTRPRTPRYDGHVPINWFERSLLAIGSAVAGIVNTGRHDMIAVLSETTGGPFLARLRSEMRNSPSGRRLLRHRPRITEQSIAHAQLATLPAGSFGREYVDWLRRNKVTPDTRDPVRYIDDPELAYIMQRYRESHDFYHVLLGFGVSLPAELVVKWFELANFGLPVALLSGLVGPLRMDRDERARLIDTYASWALKAGGQAQCLIGVEWERNWSKDINLMRRELGIVPPPMPFKEWRRQGKEIKRRREQADAS
ncbi:Ubiquinone biosynthesis protein [Microbotryomycetes sp. JL201]|nr:Ubiquinone biosynthesis protein [Microbotryomycetes sp. JL201]